MVNTNAHSPPIVKTPEREGEFPTGNLVLPEIHDKDQENDTWPHCNDVGQLFLCDESTEFEIWQLLTGQSLIGKRTAYCMRIRCLRIRFDL